jgi:3-oxoacyl-[acyl-carrier-protein] synthase II
MISGRRVVVTGLGAVAPNGSDTESFWKATVNGVSGIKKLESFDTEDYPCKIGGEALDFHAEKFLDRRTIRRTGRTAHLAVASVRLALQDSKLDSEHIGSRNVVVVFGAGCPPIDVIATDVEKFQREGPRSIEPFKLSAEDTNSVAAAIRESIGATEMAITVASGCTAGLNAIGLAAERIRSGQAKIAVCGSADAPLSPFSFAVFCASGMVSRRNSDPRKASRPFDSKRDGGVVSEGAGALILEPLKDALARGSKIYGEILGFASVTEKPRNHGEPSEEEARRAFVRSMVGCLSEAGISPEDVDYICAHAPSDIHGDRIETEAIKTVFGQWSHRVPVSSIKSCIGNPVAAAGVLQTIATLLAIRDLKIPPTINYEFPDSACDLDYVPNTWRYNRVDKGLINSHGMGGTYSSLLVGRYGDGINGKTPA